MKMIKLNGNFSQYPYWKFALQFGKPHKLRKAEMIEQFHWQVLFTNAFGADRTLNPERHTDPKASYYIWNETWTNDEKRGRILYREESVLSVVLLHKGAK